MPSDDREYEIHKNKRPDRTYISPRIGSRRAGDPARIASKVVDSEFDVGDILRSGEAVLRVTAGRRSEIVAKFYETNREITVLPIQQYSGVTGAPHRTYFSFTGTEIDTLLEFASNVRRIPIEGSEKINVSDQDLRKLILTRGQARRLVIDNQELIAELARSEVTTSDVVALRYRREQLKKFEALLFEDGAIETEREKTGARGIEEVWQRFFEGNKWIFGAGLSAVYLSGLDGRKLELSVKGASFISKGKRADAVMKSRGITSSLCLAEIKRHDTELLVEDQYRPGIWRPSDELVGAVAQAQGTAYAAVQELREKQEMLAEDGSPSGEVLFGIMPKSFLVAGRLSEFLVGEKTHDGKFRSFELYRRSMTSPEIVTYDELYYRAKFVVESE